MANLFVLPPVDASQKVRVDTAPDSDSAATVAFSDGTPVPGALLTADDDGNLPRVTATASTLYLKRLTYHGDVTGTPIAVVGSNQTPGAGPTAGGSGGGDGTWRPSHNAMLAAAFDPALIAANSGFAGDDVLRMSMVPVPTTITVANVLVSCASAQSGTLISGHNFVGLYDSTGTRIAISADLSGSPPFGGTGIRTVPLAASVTITGGAEVFVYAALNSNESSSPPQFEGRSGVATVHADVNANLPTSKFRYATASGATGLPTTVDLTTMSRTANSGQMWFGLT